MKQTREQKVEAAKQYLGDSYVFSPNYNPSKNPHHGMKPGSSLSKVRAEASKQGRI